MFIYVNNLLLRLEMLFKALQPKYRRLLLFTCFAVLIGGEILWESVQENRHEAQIAVLEGKNKELREHIHRLIKLDAAAEVEWLRDSVK